MATPQTSTQCSTTLAALRRRQQTRNLPARAPQGPPSPTLQPTICPDLRQRDTLQWPQQPLPPARLALFSPDRTRCRACTASLSPLHPPNCPPSTPLDKRRAGLLPKPASSTPLHVLGSASLKSLPWAAPSLPQHQMRHSSGCTAPLATDPVSTVTYAPRRDFISTRNAQAPPTGQTRWAGVASLTPKEGRGGHWRAGVRRSVPPHRRARPQERRQPAGVHPFGPRTAGVRPRRAHGVPVSRRGVVPARLWDCGRYQGVVRTP